MVAKTRTPDRADQAAVVSEVPAAAEVEAEEAVDLVAAVEDAVVAVLQVAAAAVWGQAAATRHPSSAIAPDERSNRSKGRPSIHSATRPSTRGLLP
jgi:hypothetical protein